MNKKIYLSVSTLIFFSIQAHSQITGSWLVYYNSSNHADDTPAAMALDSAGNIYITGSSKQLNHNFDYCTIKYYPSGIQQWVARFNGSADKDDYATGIAVDKCGNVYVTGYSKDNYEIYDYCTVKYNAAGVQQWVQTYNYGFDDKPMAITVDLYGNIFITGKSDGYNNSDLCTIKYNSNGIQVWIARHSTIAESYNGGNTLITDDYGNIYVAGYCSSPNSLADYCTIKYNSAGNQQWVSRYNGQANKSDWISAIGLDRNNNIYVTGVSGGQGTITDYCTIKYNAVGVQQWVKRYGETSNGENYARSLTIDGNGNIVVTGTISYNGQGNQFSKYCTIKYNQDGYQLWIQKYGGLQYEKGYANDVTVDYYNNVYVTGSVSSSFYYCATIKYNSSGVQQWVNRLQGNPYPTSWGNRIKIDNSNNICISAGAVRGDDLNDYLTIKYYQPIGIRKISTEIPTKYSLSQNYPNPFNPSTKIRFEIPALSTHSGTVGDIKLAVFDLLGREVTVLVSQKLTAGIYEVKFDGSNFTSGIYYYRMTSDKFVETKKMILVK